ncbi:HAD-IA family hydrolase [Phycicoccus sp.]|uniref:HAD family hydrolase n=1 Tax=Phycicoccus sp. TaxID=1902410 RepID=UPI002C61F7CE|nr:HAD-IA family hydrolase [Phycicoccus sp.]HMM94651.1 HAD-IA family hydrolase [Phycicoccus sp.]
MTGSRTVAWERYDAVLLDLDGVLTPTARVHMAAWAEMFGEFLRGLDRTRPGFEDADTAPYTDADYFAHVDGKPRYEGVADLLASRGIVLPPGSPDDPSSAETMCGLGNRKNAAFTTVLARDGVDPYPGSVALLDRLVALGTRLAVVSSSANAPAVLAAAGLADRFVTVVDGRVAADLGLAGKPAPDTFLHAAAECGTTPARAVVVEDAVSGVRAGAAGGFGLVVGVDRGAGAGPLAAAGADLVVADLGELA